MIKLTYKESMAQMEFLLKLKNGLKGKITPEEQTPNLIEWMEVHEQEQSQ
jgi:hypothetical protein